MACLANPPFGSLSVAVGRLGLPGVVPLIVLRLWGWDGIAADQERVERLSARVTSLTEHDAALAETLYGRWRLCGSVTTARVSEVYATGRQSARYAKRKTDQA